VTYPPNQLTKGECAGCSSAIRACPGVDIVGDVLEEGDLVEEVWVELDYSDAGHVKGHVKVAAGGHRMSPPLATSVHDRLLAVLVRASRMRNDSPSVPIKGFAYRRVKNDERDAADLADPLRMGRLPEAWIAPPEVRGLREAVRYRCKLVALHSGLKAQIHAVLAKQGVRVAMSDLFGVDGQRLLDRLQLDAPYTARVNSLRRLTDLGTVEIDTVAKRVGAQLSGHRGYQAIQAIHGVGPVLAAIFVVEIGDVTRFGRPQQLCSWAGLTPRHRESDTTIHRGRITKQGNHLVRWRPWKPCSVSTAVRSAPPGHDWPKNAGRTSRRSPPPASCSPRSSTGFATGTSAVLPRPGRRREHGSGAARRRGRGMTDPPGAIDALIDPTWLRPNHSMPPTPVAKGCPATGSPVPPHVHIGRWRTRPPTIA
jgi:hypothetical protein